MRKVFCFLPCMVLLLVSCVKEQMPKDEVMNLNVTLAANQSYRLNLEKYRSVLNNTAITKQAFNAEISSLLANGNSVIYNYTPASKFTGSDAVQLTVAKKGGCYQDDNDLWESRPGTKTIINIQFTIQ